MSRYRSNKLPGGWHQSFETECITTQQCPNTGLARLPLCQSGIWSTAAGKPKLSTFTLTHYGRSFHYSNVGIHDLCTSQYGNENNRDDSWRGVQLLGDGSWQIVVKDGSETIMCLDWQVINFAHKWIMSSLTFWGWPRCHLRTPCIHQIKQWIPI